MAGLHQQEKIDLKRILTRAGYTQSQDLLDILDGFLSSEQHQTVKELRQTLRRQGLDFDLKTIKGALDTFCKYGFAQVKKFNDQEDRYEHHHLGQHHDHLICTRCGRIEEFLSQEIEQLQEQLALTNGFVPLRHRMDIYGLCSDCSQERGMSVSLNMAEPGERLVMTDTIGGPNVVRRLSDMGLTKGVEVEVLSTNGGPMLISLRGLRLAIGSDLSDKIMVRPVQKISG